MALKVITEEIDGLQVRTAQLPALQAYDLLTRLGEIITPALTVIASLEGEALLDQDLGALAPVLASVFAKIKGAEGKALIKDTLALTSVVEDGSLIELTSQARIDEAFTGRLLTMFKVMAFAIRVNYRDFIDAAKAKAALAAAQKAAKKAAQEAADAKAKAASPQA